MLVPGGMMTHGGMILVGQPPVDPLSQLLSVDFSLLDDSDEDDYASLGWETLYHQTDPEAADAILRSQKMYRGSGGLAGGAIYFATNQSDTAHKAKSHGVILRAEVYLGKSKKIPNSGEDYTYTKLKRQGYDSVTIDRPGGTEYAVYDCGQVKNIRRA